MYSDVEYRVGRVRFMQTHFLDRPAIYATQWFSDTFESRARNNIAEEITFLGGIIKPA